MNALPLIHLGGSNLSVTRLSMGCYAVGGHGWGNVRDEDSIQAIRHAVAGGCNFFDTADVYGFGHSECILRKALGSSISQVVIGTKGGVRWDSSGKTWKDCSSAYLSKAIDESRRRLNLDVLPLYYVHWPDNVTPIAEILTTMARFREQGKIQAVGVSNFNLEQLREAMKITRIDAIQVKFSILDQNHIRPILPICWENRITPVFYGTLADGLLSGKFSETSTFGVDDHRSRLANFQGQRFIQNLQVVEKMRATEAAKSSTLGQIALRWVLDEVDGSIALFGAKTINQVDENLRSTDVVLSYSDRLLISTFGIS